MGWHWYDIGMNENVYIFLNQVQPFDLAISYSLIFYPDIFLSTFFCKNVFLLNCIYFFHDGIPYHIETSPSICTESQWTGFFMKRTTVMKDLKDITRIIVIRKLFSFIRNNINYIPLLKSKFAITMGNHNKNTSSDKLLQ